MIKIINAILNLLRILITGRKYNAKNSTRRAKHIVDKYK